MVCYEKFTSSNSISRLPLISKRHRGLVHVNPQWTLSGTHFGCQKVAPLEEDPGLFWRTVLAPKMGPKMAPKNGPKVSSMTPPSPYSLHMLNRKKTPFRPSFGGQFWLPKWVPKWIHKSFKNGSINRSKMDPKIAQNCPPSVVLKWILSR